jgi:hypothetical protein
MATNPFQGREYAARDEEFPAAQELADGGTVQDGRTRLLRERSDRVAEAEHLVAAADSGEAEDQ